MKKKSSGAKNLWMLTREYGDLAGAGGVKDVVAQLSRNLARWSARKVSVVLPLYGFFNPEAHGFRRLADPLHPDIDLQFTVDMHYVGADRWETVRVWYARLEKVHIYLLDTPRYREKGDVYTYTSREMKANPVMKQGQGHVDYFAMNLLLQKGALHLMLLLQQKPDIIHCHDGHTAVLPAIIHENPWLNSYFRATGCVVTVHNAGKGYHQEVADLPFALVMTGLPWQVILAGRLDGSFDPLVAAAQYAVMNTVSENYARELRETADDAMTGWLGHHLKERGVTLMGVTNGIDPSDFNPADGTARGLDCSFDPRDDQLMEGKKRCKELFIGDLATQENIDGAMQYGWLEEGMDWPLFTFIGRLSEQKGIDILIAAVQQVLWQQSNFQIVILGSGGEEIENELIEITRMHGSAGRICFLCGYSAHLANRIYSAGDFFVIPSRYEPCGLTDFIAQLFGNLPIVHHVGGLVKVVDGENGFSYTENSPAMLAETIERAVQAYQDPPLIRTMQKQAVQKIEEKYTWKVVMQDYLDLYRMAMEKRGAGDQGGNPDDPVEKAEQ